MSILNYLLINKKKTECLLFRTPGKLSNIHSFNIKIENQVINRVSEFKYLGVTFNQCLTWNDHIKSVISKADKRMLYRLRNNLTAHSANIVYTPLICPVIDYSLGFVIDYYLGFVIDYSLGFVIDYYLGLLWERKC